MKNLKEKENNTIRLNIIILDTFAPTQIIIPAIVALYPFPRKPYESSL